MTDKICPKCSGNLKSISGFKQCIKCRYVINTQNLNIDWSLQDEDGFKRAKLADDQVKPEKSHNPKRRNPLRF